MRILNNIIALFSTPSAIVLNIEAFQANLTLLNLVVTIIISLLSGVSLVFAILNGRERFLERRDKRRAREKAAFREECWKTALQLQED